MHKFETTNGRPFAKRLDRPNRRIPAGGAAVQSVVARRLVLVDRNGIFFAVQFELAVFNAIAEPPDESAHRETVFRILLGRIPPKRHVRKIAVIIWRIATHDPATVIGDIEDKPAMPFYSVNLGNLTLSRAAKNAKTFNWHVTIAISAHSRITARRTPCRLRGGR